MLKTTKPEVTPEVSIERQGAALGAYIHGIDLSEQLDDAGLEVILSALRDHHVVCLRNQTITPENHIALTRLLGEPLVTDRGLLEYPAVTEIGGPVITVQRWHSDNTYERNPLALALMVARTIPPFGDDLIFANQHTAYDLLSPAMRNMLAGLRAVHRVVMKSGEIAENVHPVVISHPLTGRKALYVNSQYTARFEGMTEEESRPLLDYLCRHCTQPRLTWRHYWLDGDVLIWDNRNVQHYVVKDVFDSASRTYHRTSTIGDVPR